MSRRGKRVALWISASLAVALHLVRASDVPNTQETEALWLVDHANLVHKVKTLEIGDVNLKGVTVAQVLDFLHRRSKLSDRDHQGINLVAKHTPELDSIIVDLELKHATVQGVIDHLPDVTDDIGDFVVTVRMGGDEEFYSRTFNVPDNLLTINPSMIVDKQKRTYDIRPLLELKGIHFPPGGSAVYDLPAKTLTVVLPDPEEIVHVDEILVFGFKRT